MLLINLPSLAYNIWCPNYSTTSPLTVEPLFPPPSRYISNKPSPRLSYYWILLLSLSALNGDSDQSALIRSTGYIAQMDRSQYSALQNEYLTTFILWYNICIYTNNKQNSNILIFVKKFYVNFICAPHYNTFYEPRE